MTDDLQTFAVVHDGAVRLYRAAGADAVRRLAPVAPDAEVLPVGEPVVLGGGIATLDVTLLGRFAVTVDGRPLGPRAFAARRGADLVKVLALAPGHRLPRDRVTDLLWPTLPADAGSANLHKAAHHARRALGDRRAVVLSGGMVRLAPEARVTTDVERFQEGDDDAYAGVLLPDDAYADWAMARREQLHDEHLARLRRQQRWNEVLAVEPADEGATLELVRRELRAGDVPAAARRLRALRRELLRIGLRPSPETVRLASLVAAGDAQRMAA